MADERKYFVLCANNCKFESMTKEQILAAIEQAVSTGTITNVDTGFVTKLKEQNAGAALSFWVGTQAQYNALETKAENCFYIITDDTAIDDIHAAIEEQWQFVTGISEDLQATKEKTMKVLYLGGEGYLEYGDVVAKISNYEMVLVYSQYIGTMNDGKNSDGTAITTAVKVNRGSGKFSFEGKSGINISGLGNNVSGIGVCDISLLFNGNEYVGNFSTVFEENYIANLTTNRAVEIKKIVGIC